MSKQAIAALKKEGLRVIMLTGDNLQTAPAIGRQVGVDDIVADLKIQAKFIGHKNVTQTTTRKQDR